MNMITRTAMKLFPKNSIYVAYGFGGVYPPLGDADCYKYRMHMSQLVTIAVCILRKKLY